MKSPSRVNSPTLAVAVACFVYKRPGRAREMLESLAKNLTGQKLKVFVFCEGPKSSEECDAVRETRMVVQEFAKTNPLTMILRERNLGLSTSILTGIDFVLSAHDAVIVLEEDLVVSPAFLPFMIENLHKYSEEKRVVSIHGYRYPTKIRLPSSFFLRGADCWGWATWNDRWSKFERDAISLQFRVNGQSKLLFNFGPRKIFTKMLESTIAGDIDSWAILWYAWAFSENLLTLYPGEPLVVNVGNDGSGTHSTSTGKFEAGLSSLRPSPPRMVRESWVGRIAFSLFLTLKY